MTLQIVAHGSYCENVEEEELPNLKPVVKDLFGQSIHRISRFIQLALIGAGRAATDLAEESAVYLSSGSGDTGAMVAVLDAIFRDRQIPKPLSFVNTVSNAACFYVARVLKLQGTSIFVGGRYFPFEMALKSALVDLQTGRTDSALVGAVDAVVLPKEDHCQRLGVAQGSKLAEGSHWLQLVRNAADRPVLATLDHVQQFGDRESLSQWISELNLTPTAYLALGQYFSPEEVDEWLSATRLNHYAYGEGVGYFRSKSGIVLTQFVARGKGTLLYLSRDPHGRYVAIVLNKTTA